MIIDAHVHLDETVDNTAKGAVEELHRQLLEADISRAVVLHLEAQPWSAEEVAEAVSLSPRVVGFINIHPYIAHAKEQLLSGIETLGYVGLKLHPRLQEFDIDDVRTVKLVQQAGEIGIPVLVDAFPDGTHLMQGFSALKYAKLAQQCPETKIIIAHMGGHHVIDFMMLAKRLPNIYFDISFSLLYYQTSSVPVDMVYAMRSMRFERILYGSDYPDRSILISLQKSLEFLKNQDINEEQLDRIMFRNAKELFGWDEM